MTTAQPQLEFLSLKVDSQGQQSVRRSNFESQPFQSPAWDELWYFLFKITFSSRNVVFELQYDIVVHWKSTQKIFSNRWKFLPRMLFHKNIRGFSSLLNIYKIPSMRYNIGAVGKCRQVPSVAHCKDRSAKCQAHDISAQKRHDRCAILFLFYFFKILNERRKKTAAVYSGFFLCSWRKISFF